MTKLVVTKTAVAAPVVAGATTGEAVVVGGATATTWGSVLWGAAPMVVAAGTGAFIGIGAMRAYEYFFDPEKYKMDLFPTDEQLDAYNAHLASAKAKKSANNIPQHIPNVPQNNTPNSPNPKKPDEPKERRKQPLSKTEAYAKIKDRYEHFEGNKYRLRDGKEPIKIKGKAVERVEWDHNHGGEWEAYPYKDGGKHLGALDPETLELYKGPVKGRNVKS
jgi:hypothetical protein